MSTILSKKEISDAITSLQTKQEVADLFAIEINELEALIQTNFNLTFEKVQKQLKTQVKQNLNNKLIMSPKTDKNTTQQLEDKVMVVEPRNATKSISLEHIKVVNNFVDGMTKTASYQKVYGENMSPDAATKGAARVLNRPEVKEYLAERISEIEAMAKVSKAKIVKRLVGIVMDKAHHPQQAIQASSQISKMMGYDSPTEVKNTIVTLTDVLDSFK